MGTVSCLALLGSWTNDFSKKKSWTNHIAELSVKFCLKKSKYTLWFQTEEIIFFLIFLTNFLFFARKSKKRIYLGKYKKDSLLCLKKFTILIRKIIFFFYLQTDKIGNITAIA